MSQAVRERTVGIAGAQGCLHSSLYTALPNFTFQAGSIFVVSVPRPAACRARGCC